MSHQCPAVILALIDIVGHVNEIVLFKNYLQFIFSILLGSIFLMVKV
jgi:hypothetical protein